MTTQKTETAMAVRSTVPIKKARYYIEKYSHITTVAKAREEESSTLNQIARKVGGGQMAALIEREIRRLLELLNIKEMSDYQINDAVQIICSEFGHYKISEVAYVFRQAKMGRMGEFYGKVDISNIGAWFDSYDREKTDSGYQQKSKVSTKRIMETNYNDPKYVTRPIKDIASKITKRPKA